MTDPKQQDNGQTGPMPVGNDQEEQTVPLTVEEQSMNAAEQELTKLKSQIAKLTDIAGRAQADLQNFKERTKRENEEFRKFANAPLLLGLLDVHDDLARAVAHDGEGKSGIAQILLKLEKILTAAGVTKMEALGKKFDSALHEIVNVGPGEKDVVTTVHQDGFLLQGNILRPAKVQVGKGEE